MRSAQWQQLVETPWDMVVVGGGITGAGVAREAARRGLKVALVEQQDYSWGTSSRSSKMVHGGLRYVAQGDFKLTRHSLTERERLLKEAPGLVGRMGYWFAHYRHKFPGRFVFGMLLTIYDLMAGYRDHRFFRNPEFLRRIPGYRQPALKGASRYTDALTDDCRLVMRVLDEARADGTLALNYVKVDDLIIEQGQVVGVRLNDVVSGQQAAVRAKVVVNATGAWADRLRNKLVAEKKVRPLRGSHVLVPHERLPVTEAVIFMHPDDNRAVFIYPWEGRTVIGTTDLDHRTDLDIEASISRQELEYMLRGANHEFPEAKLTTTDIISSFSGVRPIVSSGNPLNPSQERRDHSVWADQGLITVTGGKLTTFRLIALDVLKAAVELLPSMPLKTKDTAIFRPARASSPTLTLAQNQRLVGRFGFLTERFLTEMPSPELEEILDTRTLWAEVRWAARHEQVEHLDDLLLRRTRLGLLLADGGAAVFDRVRAICASELGWDEHRWQLEQVRYREIWLKHYSLPEAA